MLDKFLTDEEKICIKRNVVRQEEDENAIVGSWIQREGINGKWKQKKAIIIRIRKRQLKLMEHTTRTVGL